MQTTEKIKAKLITITMEIERLNKLYFDNPDIGSQQFYYRNGQNSTVEGHSFDKEISGLVREKSLLKWVLGIKD